MNIKQLKQKKARILIIEDSVTIQKLTKQVLTFREEYEIFFAENGEKGMRMIKNSDPFHVILIDIDMPVMDGKKCIQEIRSLREPAKANLPVIACTGNGEENTPEEFEEMGFDALFVKPLDYKGLLEIIKPVVIKAVS